MMRFVAKPEPKDFDKNVRFPGTRALKELRGDPRGLPLMLSAAG